LKRLDLMRKLSLWLISLCLLALMAITVNAAAPSQAQTPATIYFFWGDGCPHCAQAKPFLQELEQRYPNLQVESFEIYYVPENQELFKQMAAAHNFEPRYVPTFFIGDRQWEGFSEDLRQELEAAVRACSEQGCADAGVGVIPGHEPTPEPPATPTPTPVAEGEDDSTEPSVITVPFLGTIDLGAQALWVSTALISFVDGFNPCSLWVLSILISLTLRTGSRKKTFIIGLIFITVTALVYVLFIAGLFTMLTFVRFLSWIQVAVSLLALFFALVNIKDYFWYKEGLSFTIDDAKKPGLYKRMRRVLNAGDSLGALVLATVGLAVGVSLVEFSCTAGFPVLWTNLIAAQNVTPLTFGLLLLLYMVIYQLDELAIFGVAVVTLRASKLEEKHGRILKLIGGMLMLTLAIVMLVNPALMNDLRSSLLIFGAAFGMAVVILVIHRVLLPRLGLHLGTEKLH
jgi:thiol-disulfide isomerase/thioredoxin